MAIGAHISVEKIDYYNKCANCWLCGCEELCTEEDITWHVVGYFIGHYAP